MITCACGNMTDREIGWLIEGDGNYWDGKYVTSQGFTRKVDEACRFARFEDAEIVKHWLLQQHSFALRTTQHVWVNAAHT